MSKDMGRDQIMRIFNAMLKISSLTAEYDIFGKYSSEDVLLRKRICDSGGW